GVVVDVVDPLAAALGIDVQKMQGQLGNVFTPFPQGRNPDVDDFEPVIQVFAEAALANELFEILMSGRDNAHVHLERLAGADALESLFLQHAEQLGLDFKRNIANFVQEEGAPIRQFESPNLVFMRARESSLDVAKQLAFQESRRQSGAMNFDESLVAPRAVGVQGAGEKFFAGATFTADQNGGL